MAEEILSEAPGISPIENLPVASGKRRRGRPRKIRDSEMPTGGSVAAAAPDAAPIADVVKVAVKDAIKESKTRVAGPTTRKGIVALAKQVARAQARRDVRDELERTGNLESGDVVGVLADEDKKEIAAQPTFGPGHPRWFELRNR